MLSDVVDNRRKRALCHQKDVVADMTQIGFAFPMRMSLGRAMANVLFTCDLAVYGVGSRVDLAQAMQARRCRYRRRGKSQRHEAAPGRQ